ncbi:MAG: hypothetical protein JNL79_32775 [Myxococcales bacterium]|nr:hypothetical protein [Myxococcales bacterium]
MRHSAYQFPAALLPSGKVVALEAVESVKTRIYDPGTNSWSNLNNVPERLNFHTIAPLPSGRVLLMGGISPDGTAPYERAKAWELDPVANTWTPVGAMSTARFAHASVALGDGTVLVAGGRDNGSGQWSSAEIYNPATKTWAATGAMSTFRVFPNMALMPSGKAILSLGDSLEIYDTTAKTWSVLTGVPVETPRFANLPTGQIVLFNPLASSLFDPSKSGSAAFTTLPAPPSGAGSVINSLNDGRALLSGGTTTAILYALNIGQSCGSSGQCLSGSCVDGVCCDSGCGASCMACNVTGKVGTCSAIPVGEAPRGSRASCAPYFCAAGGACATVCAVDTDCTTGNYCDGTTKKCLPKKANGTACGRVGECTSAQCTDGVCCNLACGGQCEACDLAASKGTCSPVAGAPRGARTACGTGTGKTCELQLCDGVDRTACHFPPVSTTCSSNACAAGIETHASTCDAAGACKDVPKDCGVYKCGATACKTSCTVKADCIAGYSCVGGACTPSIGLGKPCSDASACGDLLCVDGVCCGIDAPATTCATGYACNAPGKEGTCTLKNGEKCDLASKCGSGLCADGVCCDKACDGQCEACDATGAVGKCTGIAGAPHGSRPKCDDGASDVCKARTCNGAADPKACVGYVNDSSKLCAPKKCVGSDYTDFSFCDGAGTCKSPGASSCVPYKCDDKGCLKACTDATQCADGFSCKEGKCVQGATCKDTTTSVSKDGVEEKCDPYRCRSTGECAKECATTDDCSPGYACDAKSCVPIAPTDTGDSGGCAVGSPRPSVAGFALLGLALLGGVGRRRRR